MFSNADPWVREHNLVDLECLQIVENLRQRDGLQRGTRGYIRINEEIKTSLSKVEQQLQEMTELLNQQSITGTITEHEGSRRQMLLQKVDRRYQDLRHQYTNSPKDSYMRNELLGDEGLSKETTVSWGEAGGSNSAHPVQQRVQAQEQYLQEQDDGLEDLSKIMSRTKDIAQSFTAEIDLHNEIIEDVGDTMDRVNERLIRNTQRTASLGTKVDTCGYWIIIVALLVAIVIVALV